MSGKIFEKNIKMFQVDLNHRVISEIKRVSKPGRRVYSAIKDLAKIKNGLGIAVLSTSKGVMSDTEARYNNVGGEIICYVS